MKVAIKYGAFDAWPVVGDNGDVQATSAPLILARRLLRLFPNSILVGDQVRAGNGFQMLPLGAIDPCNTLVINMDVLDSVGVWQQLHSFGAEPKLMNFAWHNPSMYHHKVNYAAMGLSFGLFPTLCNSARTAEEVREVVRKWAVSPIASSAKLAWVNLGVRVARVQPRQEPEIPVVLYPAITMAARKQPKLFVDVVDAVAKRVPLRVEARLQQAHLVSDIAMNLSMKKYAWVGPLTPTRNAYWEALARTTAFLATANEESYGLEYLEAMLSGAVGIFPDAEWIRTVVPEGYPFVYRDRAEAEQLLEQVLTHPEESRAKVDASAPGGSLAAWIRELHDDEDFDDAFTVKVTDWFGPVTGE